MNRTPDVPNRQAAEKRGLTAINGALALIAVLLIVQIWLLTASLEALLAGHPEAAIPGAIISAILFVGVFALYRFSHRVDRQAHRRP